MCQVGGRSWDGGREYTSYVSEGNVGVAAIAKVEKTGLPRRRQSGGEEGERRRCSGPEVEVVKQHGRLLPPRKRVYTSRDAGKDANFERHCAVTCDHSAPSPSACKSVGPLVLLLRRGDRDIGDFPPLSPLVRLLLLLL